MIANLIDNARIHGDSEARISLEILPTQDMLSNCSISRSKIMVQVFPNTSGLWCSSGLPGVLLRDDVHRGMDLASALPSSLSTFDFTREESGLKTGTMVNQERGSSSNCPQRKSKSNETKPPRTHRSSPVADADVLRHCDGCNTERYPSLSAFTATRE